MTPASRKSLRRIIVLANRLPVHRVRSGGGGGGGGSTKPGGQKTAWWESSAGGLVTAMQPVLKRVKGSWIGWPGVAGDVPKPFMHDGVDIRPVSFSANEVESAYHGMANKTLWPLYHDAIRTPEFHRHWWKPYLAVNERFAKTAARLAKPGDVAWVHDYHLQLVPGMLREMRPEMRVGFFLHIPFPPEELFEWLPWRTEILEGLLGADVIGFQTASSARNFSRIARIYTAAEGTDTQLEYQGRTIRVGSFPISIDTQWWEERAAQTTTEIAAREIRRRIGTRRKIYLAVDRLDYTKGINYRLQAFEELLKSGRASVRDVVLMQIAVPSREDVVDYTKLRAEVERMVGRINGQFGEPGRVAVHYFHKNFTREQLTAYYRAADVMLVTPLRDGMNLVAKEFAACRVDNTGVLVLSQFAGAAQEFTRALIVNPRDLDQMTNRFEEAIKMPKDDAATRMAILRMRLKRHDVHDWANEFLEALLA